MVAAKQESTKTVKPPKRKPGKAARIDNFYLTVLALPTIVLMLVFAYWPMYGVILAFKNFKVTDGIWGSPWRDPLFANFEFFFKSQDAWRLVRNTVGLNILFIAVTTVCTVVFALLMFEVKKRWEVKTFQTFSIMPSFLSWVIVSYVVYIFLDPSKGVINSLIVALGGEGISWYTEPAYWPMILLITKIWQGVGLGSIIYYAALMGIDGELFEAADIDGASKLQKIKAISIPSLVPIVTVMTLLAIGNIFRGDFGLFYNVTRNVGALYPTTDVIDTYVFRALMKDSNIGMSSAVGLFQSVVCTITLVVSNGIVRKVDPDNSLF